MVRLRYSSGAATLLACLFSLAAAGLSPAGAQQAVGDEKPPLSPMFTDNMVLQRGIPDPIWGWTTPGTKVTVGISGGGTASAIAGPDGKWLARLPVLSSAGPYTVTVTGASGTPLTLNNVAAGDVWVCSGQSNMQFGIGGAIGGPQEMAVADHPDIRLMTVPMTLALSPRGTVPVHWEVCSPDTIKHGTWNGFSAVAYYFGRNLEANLHIPIGLIFSSWGGTPAEAWTSASALTKSLPEFQQDVEMVVQERGRTPEESARERSTQIAGWYAKNDPGSAHGTDWAQAAFDDSSWPTIALPGYWERSGIAGFAQFDGVAWFRKEFELPDGAAGKDLRLHFLADDDDTAWVNGVEVGQSFGAGIQRSYPIPASVLHAGRNVVTIRVLDQGGYGGIFGPANGPLIDFPGGQPVSLAGPWRYEIGGALSSSTPLPRLTLVNQNSPSVLYNGMINPLVPYGIKGAIWYQGESNASHAYQYRTLLPTMISDWRQRWGEGAFPFLIVQLAGFSGPPAKPGDDAWAELREAQWLTDKNMPNAGIATAIDIGDAHDIHPKDKADVGARLALVAEKQVYGKSVEDSGPVFRAMTVTGNAARIMFDHADGGLVAKDSATKQVSGFAVAGADRKWQWADAVIDGSAVVVSSPLVPNPVAVRYAWASYLPLNLYNAAGLPAFPFRTDDWTPSTKPK